MLFAWPLKPLLHCRQLSGGKKGAGVSTNHSPDVCLGHYYRARVARVDVAAGRAYVDIGTPRHALLQLDDGQTIQDNSDIVVCVDQLPTVDMPAPKNIRVRLVDAAQLTQEPQDLRRKHVKVRRSPQSVQQQLLAGLLIALSMSIVWWFKS